MAGQFPAEELELTVNGIKKAEAIKRIGGDPARLEHARRQTESFHAYLELHIEQGGTLEKAGLPIGVVEGIVSIERLDVTVRGFANHAGTTPMGERQDALIAASQLILAIREIVTREPGRQVGTVGKLEVSPNATNVVPGVVKHTIDLRDLDAAKLARLADEIRARAATSGPRRAPRSKSRASRTTTPRSRRPRCRRRSRGPRTRSGCVGPACRAAPGTTPRWPRGSARWA